MIERIVQINDLSDPRGGASKLAVQAACDFAARGHRVTFITGDSGESPALAAAGVEILALGQHRLLAHGRARAALTGLWNRAAHALIAAWVAANDTPGTVYHLHGWAQILSPAVFAALDPVRERLVVSAHDFFLACPNGAFASMQTGATCPHVPLSLACLTSPCDRDGTAQKLWRSTRQAVLRQAYRPHASPPVLAVHDSMRGLLERGGIPAHTIQTLPNPVVPFQPERIAAERNRAVLYVGRLEETKGVDLAARAAALAEAPLIVVGEGPLADHVRHLHPAARLVGRRSPAEIGAFAAEARMLVMPSRYPEPFGLAAMEAAWSGLPVILARSALLAEDLVARGAALAVDPRNEIAFTQAIRTIGQDDTLALAMSRAAFTHTRDIALTPTAWIEQLETILAQRLNDARTTSR